MKTLIIDIETAPLLTYVWKVWKENIGEKQLLRHSYMMCFACKWLGEDEVYYFETRTSNDKELIKKAYNFLDEADIVIAHNADRFDIPKINTYAIQNGLKPPSPYKVIDTLKIAKKKFFFTRNTLEHIANYLGCSPKLNHQKFSGFDLWLECIRGNEEAWKEMKMYNIQDVITLEEVYLKLRPFIDNHPNVSIKKTNIDGKYRCPKCGSDKVQKRGTYETNTGIYQRYRCNECGGWSRTRYTETEKDNRKQILRSV